MPWTESERDPDAFASVLTAFEGKRHSLDPTSLKVLRIMLERPEGCDARVSADRFEMRLGWHPARHRYHLRTAPAVVTRLLELAGAAPGERDVQAEVGPLEMDGWTFGRRRVWLLLTGDCVTIHVRAADPPHATFGLQRLPAPQPIDFVPRFLDFPNPVACPHCATRASSFRHLLDGSLVCGACGRSFDRSGP